MTTLELITQLKSLVKTHPELATKEIHFWSQNRNNYLTVDYILTKQCKDGPLLCYDDGMM